MKGITNNTYKDLTWEQTEALIKAGWAIEGSFGLKIHTIYVNGDKESDNPTKVTGIVFVLDKYRSLDGEPKKQKKYQKHKNQQRKQGKYTMIQYLVCFLEEEYSRPF